MNSIYRSVVKKKRTRVIYTQSQRIRISQTAFISPRFIRESLHTQSSSETFCLIKSYDRWRFVRQRPKFEGTWHGKNISRDRNVGGCYAVAFEYVKRCTTNIFTALFHWLPNAPQKFQRKPTTFLESLWKPMSEAPQMLTTAAVLASVKYVILVHYIYNVNVQR